MITRASHVSMALALLGWAGSPTAAVILRGTSAAVDQRGELADVCLVLDSGGAQVTGVGNDLVSDGCCATLSDSPGVS